MSGYAGRLFDDGLTNAMDMGGAIFHGIVGLIQAVDFLLSLFQGTWPPHEGDLMFESMFVALTRITISGVWFSLALWIILSLIGLATNKCNKSDVMYTLGSFLIYFALGASSAYMLLTMGETG